MAPRKKGARKLRARLESELRPDERLVWSTQPDPAAFARLARGAVLFAILACVVNAVITRGALESWGVIGAIMLVPFWLIALWLFAAPRRARRRAEATIYGVTDRRAIIVTVEANLEARSFYARDLGDVKRVERAEDFGDLILKPHVKSAFDGEQISAETGFYGVRGVRHVEQLLDDVRSAKDAPDS